MGVTTKQPTSEQAGKDVVKTLTNFIQSIQLMSSCFVDLLTG